MSTIIRLEVDPTEAADFLAFLSYYEVMMANTVYDDYGQADWFKQAKKQAEKICAVEDVGPIIPNVCPACGTDRANKGSYLFKGRVFCDENCAVEWDDAITDKRLGDYL